MKWLIGIGNRIRDGFYEFCGDDFWDDFWENKFPIVFVLVAISPVIIVCILHVTGLLHELLNDGKPKPKDDCVKVYSVRGEAHEYLMDGNQITHLPNCKFCKGEVK